jgi:hypothetical protein
MPGNPPEFSSDDFVKQLQQWGRQTLSWAVSVQAWESGEVDLDTNAAAEEVEDVAQQLWEAAFNESPKPVHPHVIAYNFCRRVFNWCGTRRGWTPKQSG